MQEQQVDFAKPEPDDLRVWSPPVLSTAAAKGEGITEVIDAFDAHWSHLVDTGALQDLRKERLARHTRDVVHRGLSILVWEKRDGEERLQAGLDDVVEGRKSPYKLAHEIVSALQEGAGHGE